MIGTGRQSSAGTTSIGIDCSAGDEAAAAKQTIATGANHYHRARLEGRQGEDGSLDHHCPGNGPHPGGRGHHRLLARRRNVSGHRPHLSSETVIVATRPVRPLERAADEDPVRNEAARHNI
jgi:hypothetical protein